MNELVHTSGRRLMALQSKPVASKQRAALRSNDPDRTMAEILRVATTEFAEKGFAGARVDEIAAATRTSKRMIYYYFQSKEGLYLAVLEQAYARIRALESSMHLADLPPLAALKELVGRTFDYQTANPDFVRLVMNENIMRGQYLAQSTSIGKLNIPAIDLLRDIYDRGVRDGVFRAGLDPIDIHMSISALAFFNTSNRHTFSMIFRRNMESPKMHKARRDTVIEMIVRFVTQ